MELDVSLLTRDACEDLNLSVKTAANLISITPSSLPVSSILSQPTLRSVVLFNHIYNSPLVSSYLSQNLSFKDLTTNIITASAHSQTI